MARYFNLKFQDDIAYVSVQIPCGEGFLKKTFKAKDGEELWQGLRTLEAIQELSPVAQAEFWSPTLRAKEREELQALVDAWLAKGNKIKVLPPAGHKKLHLSEKEKEDVLSLLENLALEDIAA